MIRYIWQVKCQVQGLMIQGYIINDLIETCSEVESKHDDSKYVEKEGEVR